MLSLILLVVSCGFVLTLSVRSILSRNRGLLLFSLTAGTMWNVMYPLFTWNWYAQPLGVVMIMVPLFIAAQSKKELFHDRYFLSSSLFLTTVFLGSVWVLGQLHVPCGPQELYGVSLTRKVFLIFHQFSTVIFLVPVILIHWIRTLRTKTEQAEGRYLLTLCFINAVSLGTLFHLPLQMADWLLLAPLAGFILTLPLCFLWRFTFRPEEFPVRSLLTSVVIAIPFIASVCYHFSFLIELQHELWALTLALVEAAILLLLSGWILKASESIARSLKFDHLLSQVASGSISDSELFSQSARLLQGRGFTKPQLWRLSEILNSRLPQELRCRVSGVVEALKEGVNNGS